MSSGSALSPWASVHDPNDLRIKIGEQVGCTTKENDDIADCLRGVPLKTLMDMQLPEIRWVGGEESRENNSTSDESNFLSDIAGEIKVIKYVFRNWYRLNWNELISLFHLFIYDSTCRCNKYCLAHRGITFAIYIAGFVFIA